MQQVESTDHNQSIQATGRDHNQSIQATSRDHNQSIQATETTTSLSRQQIEATTSLSKQQTKVAASLFDDKLRTQPVYPSDKLRPQLGYPSNKQSSQPVYHKNKATNVTSGLWGTGDVKMEVRIIRAAAEKKERKKNLPSYPRQWEKPTDISSPKPLALLVKQAMILPSATISLNFKKTKQLAIIKNEKPNLSRDVCKVITISAWLKLQKQCQAWNGNLSLSFTKGQGKRGKGRWRGILIFIFTSPAGK